MISIPFFAVAESELNQYQKVSELLGLPVFGVTDTGVSGTAITLKSMAGEHVLRAAPRFCLGLFAATPAAQTILFKVQAIFSAWSGVDYPAPVMITDESALAIHLTRALAPELTRAAAAVVELSKGLAQLRGAHEVLQNNFARAERLLEVSLLAPPRCTFEALPSDRYIAAGAHEIVQRLPAGSAGFAALELYFPIQLASIPAGGIDIELRTVETREQVGRWILHAEHWKAGWVVLALPVAIDGLSVSLELCLKPLGEFLALPELSLSEPLPLARFQVRVDGVALPASLALRCWVGLPGVKVRLTDSLAALTDNHAGEIMDVPFPPRLCATVRRYCQSWDTLWEIVRALPESSGVFCHPPPPNIIPNFVVAVIPDVMIDRPARIAARCVVADERAAPVEFGIVTLPSGSDVYSAITSGRGFSGWIRASFESPGHLSAFVPANVVNQQIYFVTRMADGESNSYAQASFENLTITFLGPRETGIIQRSPIQFNQMRTFHNALDPTDESVIFKEAEHVLLCHPVKGAPKIGIIERLLQSTARGLCGQVWLGHPEAKATQFNVAISRRAAAEVLASAEQNIALPGVALSGWIEVRPTESGRFEISVEELPAPAVGEPDEFNFYVITRLAPGVLNADYTWAYIDGIQVLLPVSTEET